MQAKTLGMRAVLGAVFALLVMVSCGGDSETTPTEAREQPRDDPPPTQDAATPDPLANPIPEKIAFSEIAIRAVPFLQLPRTQDMNPRSGNNAHARIQYVVPVPDGSGRLAINDTRGQLYLTDAEGEAYALYLDHRQEDLGFDNSQFANEMGFMAVAFHPNFARPGEGGHGKFYTSYTATSASGTAHYLENDSASHESVVREWTTTDTQANTFSGTSREILRVGHFAPNHNVGNVAFNPTAKPGDVDFGMLYIGMGDGGSGFDPRNYGQSLSSPLGAILRIDPLGGDGSEDYGIPADNPFVGRRDALAEIWAYGLRHPQHFSWDTDGRLFLTDIGQNQVEEINLGSAGANYGWRLREGKFATGFAYEDGRSGPVYPLPERDDPSLVYPIAHYDHDEGNAVGSGFVYRGEAISALRGKYVFTELVRGRLFVIDADNAESGRLQTVRELRLEFEDGKTLPDVAGHELSSGSRGGRVDARLGMDGAGELYLLTKGDGQVRRLVPGQ